MGRFQAALYRFFSGRRGPDQLAVIIAALVLSVLASILGWSLLSLLSLVIWAWALYRMLSRNIPAREKENAWFLKWYSPLVAQARQAHTRFKNRKVYLYYRCPQCRAWLRLPRNIGEKTVTCGKCGATFKKKA